MNIIPVSNSLCQSEENIGLFLQDFFQTKKEQPADGCSSLKREGISYWFIAELKKQRISENIGEFSQDHYITWDENCPAKNHLC